jgi:arabinogalactan endo-1,4-beta-galactosidase
VDPQRYNVLLNAFEVNHVHYDWVGLSSYPYWDQKQHLEFKDGHTIIDCVANINGIFNPTLTSYFA